MHINIKSLNDDKSKTITFRFVSFGISYVLIGNSKFQVKISVRSSLLCDTRLRCASTSCKCAKTHNKKQNFSSVFSMFTIDSINMV